VLVVDDDEDLRDALAMVVTSAGFEPVRAADGREALDHLERCAQLPSVIVLDLKMPGLDGREVLRRLPARAAAIPVVVLTASHDPVPAGVVAALRKPITLELLLDALVTHCR